MNKITREELISRQSLTLEDKIRFTQVRIQEWYENYQGKVYVAFSGGKDSTVLLHLVRSLYPDVPAVFFDTGLEFPEIKKFIRGFDRVVWIRPKLSFHQVIDKYGYPVVSKENARKIREVRNARSPRPVQRILHGTDSARLPNKWRFLLDAPFKISDQCCEAMKGRNWSPALFY